MAETLTRTIDLLKEDEEAEFGIKRLNSVTVTKNRIQKKTGKKFSIKQKIVIKRKI